MGYYNNPYFNFYPVAQIPQGVPYPQQQMVDPSQMQAPQMQPAQMQATQMPNRPAPQPMADLTQDSYFIWVQGEAGAKSYPVARGTTLPLFDTEGDFIYFKSVDNNGIPLPLVKKVLSDPPVETRVAAVPTTALDTGNYVTKHEYDELEKKCSELENRIMELETRPDSIPATNPHTVQH